MKNPSRERYDLRAIAHAAMADRGLKPEFSAAVMEEARALREGAELASAKARDLRHLLWASIDNDDSRDLDQLSVAEALADGRVRVLVAIADVDALVRKGSEIDGHAETNTTSVYTAAQIFPMLPERLSTDLTSLNQDETRLAMVIDMIVGGDGEVAAGEVYAAVVRNHAKLAYNSVSAWLDGAGSMPERLAAVAGLDEQLRIQDRTAQAMRRQRHTHGALQLETAEARPVYEGEALVDMRPDQRNRAKDLIEDFMVAANGVTARFLAARKFPSLRRVLKTPRRWDRILALAAELGERLPPEPDSAALDAFLDRRRQIDPAGFAELSLSVVKMLGSGEYALELPGGGAEGHFGLAVRDYSHSTAPNRRFPDLIAQRLVKAALAGREPPYSNEELSALARHCTLQEDNAQKVERQVQKSAAALLLTPQIGKRFAAIVTGASQKGVWVRISGPTAEGKVVRGAEGLDVGDHVRVDLVGTDVERGFIDFALVRDDHRPRRMAPGSR